MGHPPPSNLVPPVAIALDVSVLRPLITEIVRETLAAVEAERVALPDRLAFSEPEAARLMGMQPHQLRDERGRGNITASQVVGRRIRYLREDLMRYLMSRRTDGSAN